MYLKLKFPAVLRFASLRSALHDSFSALRSHFSTHDSTVVAPEHAHKHLSLKRYFHRKVVVLVLLTVVFYSLKIFFAFELNKYTETLENASLFADLLFIGSND